MAGKRRGVLEVTRGEDDAARGDEHAQVALARAWPRVGRRGRRRSWHGGIGGESSSLSATLLLTAMSMVRDFGMAREVRDGAKADAEPTSRASARMTLRMVMVGWEATKC